MDLPLNPAEPRIMHIDLNSCFASIEQQANPLLRDRPIAVAAYTTPNACILAPSIEAKRFGVKTGMRVREGRERCPDLAVLAPDPPKYRAVHLLFRRILNDYTPAVTPLSIDEAVLDFSAPPAPEKPLTIVAQEIKDRLRREIGECIRCSVGIGPSRFLAKTGASFRKPDGLTVISAGNLREIYQQMTLLDLHGINVRYQARLHLAEIFTPLQFLEAPLPKLMREVFRSIQGHHWFFRLRGWESDGIEFGRRSYGQSYALPKPITDLEALAPILLKLCEKMGRRLRRAGYAAHSVWIGCIYRDGRYWNVTRTFGQPRATTLDLYRRAYRLLGEQPSPGPVSKLMVSCAGLTAAATPQLGLFDSLEPHALPGEGPAWGGDDQRASRLSIALDSINDRFGEFTVVPGLLLGMESIVLDRIAFGGVKELIEPVSPEAYTG